MVFGDKRIHINTPNNKGIVSTGKSATNNLHIHQHVPQTLNRTFLYDFCEKLISSVIGYDEYEITNATNFDDKIHYNEIDLYKDIFYECDYYLEDVEIMLEEIPNRQIILQKINWIYKKEKKFSVWNCKDQLCENVYMKLFEQIQTDQKSQHLIIEEVELSLHLLMYYSFTKCKLLDPIPEEEQ